MPVHVRLQAYGYATGGGDYSLRLTTSDSPVPMVRDTTYTRTLTTGENATFQFSPGGVAGSLSFSLTPSSGALVMFVSCDRQVVQSTQYSDSSASPWSSPPNLIVIVPPACLTYFVVVCIFSLSACWLTLRASRSDPQSRTRLCHAPCRFEAGLGVHSQ
ncbi:MAG: hypothetical protein EOO65_02765 [Methanosarcinales archaeon]|nr:MAG: hypothetical protein EOO65_02765 [Methanosarcinales archaeon]